MNDNTIPGISVPLERVLEEARLKLAIARDYVQDLKDFGITEIWLEQLETDITTAVSYPTFADGATMKLGRRQDKLHSS